MKYILNIYQILINIIYFRYLMSNKKIKLIPPIISNMFNIEIM